MQTSNKLILEIKAVRERLQSAELDLQRPISPLNLGPMDEITPYTHDAARVRLYKDKLQELNCELGAQILRERG